jgi:hypothetical protein
MLPKEIKDGLHKTFYLNKPWYIRLFLRYRHWKFARWLRKHSRPISIGAFKMNVSYSKKNLKEMKKILDEYSIDDILSRNINEVKQIE